VHTAHEVCYNFLSTQDAVHPDGSGAPESNPRQVISLGRFAFRISVIRIPEKVLAIILSRASDSLSKKMDMRSAHEPSLVREVWL